MRLGEAALGDFQLGGFSDVDVVGTVTPITIEVGFRAAHVTLGLRRRTVTVDLRADHVSCAFRDLAVALDNRSGGVEAELDEALVLA